jgi:hypothetical protein
MYKINKPNARVPFQRRCSNWILSSQDPKYLPSGHLHNLLLWGLFELSNSFLNNISYSTFLTLSQSVLVRLEVSFILLPGAFMRLNKHLSFCVLKIVEAWHALQPCKVYIYVCVWFQFISFVVSQTPAMDSLSSLHIQSVQKSYTMARCGQKIGFLGSWLWDREAVGMA